MIKEQEEAIKRCKKLIEVQNANWIGISNQLAIKHILEELKQYKKKTKELEEENKRKDVFVEMAKEVIENSILKQKVKDLIKDETINITGFECIPVEDIQELLEEK